MPEIIEVKHCADLIKKRLKNSKILEINLLNGRYKNKGPFENYSKLKSNLPLKIIDVKTKGKMLYIIFENDMYLISKLGLMGGWCYLKKDSDKYEFPGTYKHYSNYISKEEMSDYTRNVLNHLNVEFKTKDGTLYYHDVVSYGTLKCVDREGLNKSLDDLGPDIMEESTTYSIFKEAISKKKNINKNIANVLVDQKIISGIGNYLRADILYMSALHPLRKVKNLLENDFKELYFNSKALIWGTYNEKKATKLRLINKNTLLPSRYNRLFLIYIQDTDIYGNKVIKKVLENGSQKRTIYYVTNIQK